MSVEALAWAFRQHVGDPIGKLVLIALANHANEDWVCTPGRKTLAKHAECSVDSVDRRLVDLIEARYVSKENRVSGKGDPTSNSYRLNRERVAADSGYGVAADSGEGSRTPAATMMNHHPEPDIFADADGNPPPPAKTTDADFEDFWRAYPKKVGKKKARELFVKHIKPTDLPQVMRALATQCKSEQWLKDGGKYIVDPERWIKNERWQDELPLQNHANNRTTHPAGRQSHHMQQGRYAGIVGIVGGRQTVD